MASVTNTYAAKATVTITMTSLANSTGARQSTAVDNTTTKYLDAIIRVKSNGIAGSTANVDFYLAASLSDGVYVDNCTGTDAAFTTTNLKNAIYLGSVTLNTTTQQIGAFSVVKNAGFLPSKFVLIAVNNSGAALSATAGDHVVEFEGLTRTVA